MATHSNTLVWKISWTMEPGELQPKCHKQLDTTQHTRMPAHSRASQVALVVTNPSANVDTQKIKESLDPWMGKILWRRAWLAPLGSILA